jgi:transposase-like protein
MYIIMDINNFSDEDLKKLMIKYKEKQSRYELIYNEQTIRNERIILNIHLEQVRRWRERNVQAFKESRMDTSS